MIVVAASDQNDALATFSNFGANTVDLAAPGVNILSTIPTTLPSTAFQTPTGEVGQGTNLYSANLLTFSGMTTGITATAYDCGLGNPADFPPAVSGNIALISRGTLFFSDKVNNAMAAGAIAAVIYNNTNGNFLGTLQNSGNWIPALSISQADGLALKALTPVTLSLTTVYMYLDGTSMATPHVVGAVALAAMNFPNETVAQRIQRILGNVDVKASLSGLVRTGGRLNLQRMLDSDLNGLPDWWEQDFFGQLTGTNPNADPDHDGASNLAEWLAGTNPTNATSALRLTASRGTNGFVLRWPSATGKTYRLLRGTNLATGFNAVLQTNIAATPPTNTMNDTSIAPVGARFYRLQLEQ
jgi:subtilisin family serine protease